MKKWQVYVVVISLLVHLAASRVENGIEGRTVMITNTLGGGVKLTVHCKSKNDDLGVQTLAPDSTWSFKFTPAFFATTLFFCNFKWGRESHWFDIYDDNRDGDNEDHPCYLCSWKIYRSLVCKMDESTGSFNLCYGWNK
ncbi:hypothetical protein N665_0006s0180 [Sinapis alba]|nr:hypothetical protein N665_0006s0180 [Sinapis alba]